MATVVVDAVRMAAREIDRTSAVPPSRQVAGWLAEDIRAGVYQPGQRLPSITDLVQLYGIARDTALKAQRILITDGLAENSPGMGLFVVRELPDLALREIPTNAVSGPPAWYRGASPKTGRAVPPTRFEGGTAPVRPASGRGTSQLR